MESCVSAIVVVALIAGLAIIIRQRDAMQRRLEEANRLGWQQGYFEGWIAHAKAVPLHVVPPTLFEIEEVLRQRHGWRIWVSDSLYDYLRIEELADGVGPESSEWKEWQAQKLKEINKKYLGVNE